MRLLPPIYFLLTFINGEFWNLYDTQENNSLKDHSCLYYYTINTAISITLIPYCIRSNYSSNRTVSDLWNINEQYSFKELQADNIKTVDLMSWSVPIEAIENYQIYLDYGDHSHEFIYNCSEFWFGPRCQYTFDRLGSFYLIVTEDFRKRDNIYDSSLENIGEITPAYVHLDSCKRIDGLNLIWQEICDRKSDCLGGEDERHCIELEANTCHWNDGWRCGDGACIPASLLGNHFLEQVCLDQSDEPARMQSLDSLQSKCSNSPNIECEERTCTFVHMSHFACGDGQCVQWAPPSTEAQCVNGRDVQFTRHLLNIASVDVPETCWFAVICLLQFHKVLSLESCDGEEALLNISSCPAQFFSPSIPLSKSMYNLFTKPTKPTGRPMLPQTMSVLIHEDAHIYNLQYIFLMPLVCLLIWSFKPYMIHGIILYTIYMKYSSAVH